ncbi:ABC transporter permease subunit [Actinomycetota bacterium]
MTSGIDGLELSQEFGWRSGLAPLMRAGFGSWWTTKEWWINALIWTVVINGSVAVAVWGDAPDGLSAYTLYGVMTMFAAIAVAILMQDAIVGEKLNGTAAWVLSKPASRTAFMLSKLVPNAVGVIATMIAIPSAVFMVQLAVADIGTSADRFILGAAVAALNLMFYLTLTLMLGTLFNSAAPVIAIPLAFAFGQQLLGGIPGLSRFLPWTLVVPSDGSDTSVVSAVITGETIETPGAIAVATIACIAFTIVAFRTWNRTEL